MCREHGVGYCGANRAHYLRSSEFDSWLPHPDGDFALRRLFATHFRTALAARSRVSLTPETVAAVLDLARGMDGIALRATDVSSMPARRVILGSELNAPPPAKILVRCPDGKPLIPADSIGVAFGPSGSLKSFAFVHLAAAIAAGRPTFGDLPLAYEPGAFALYVGAEDAAGLHGRLYHAFAPSEPRRFGFFNGPVIMTDAADVLDFIHQAKAQVGSATPVALVVLDTLNQTLGSGSDENSASVAGAYTANMRLLRQAFPGSAVTTIHHPSAGGTRERGSTALRNNVDFSLEFKAGNEELTTAVRVAKMKNGPDDGKTLLRFAQREDSLVLVATVPPVLPAGAVAVFAWTPPRLNLLRALHAATQRGEVLRAASWRKAAAESSGSNAEAVRAELIRLMALDVHGPERAKEYRLNQAGIALAGELLASTGRPQLVPSAAATAAA